MPNTMITEAPPTASTLHMSSAIQRVMIVNGCLGILELIETILEAGHYDVVFVSSSEHAYSQIKRVRPDLVVLCLRIDEPNGFQVLSMLKLDGETRDIPVLTYTTAQDIQEVEQEMEEPVEIEMLTARAMELMN
jgi:CheY-like chemotaxis protein